MGARSVCRLTRDQTTLPNISAAAKSQPMTDTSRIDELEIKVAHQEQTIEDLNAAITAQWKLIDKLERDMARLTERVASAEDSLADVPPADQPPPHY